jgi:CheY-like chemotaxis protein
MNGILGVVRIVHGLPLDGKLRRYIETIDSSASALLTIINDVLDFSKMEAGKYSLQRVVFDLRTVVQEVCELLATRAHDKGLELICRIDPAMGFLHHGDPDRLRQVISNLVGNAIKFTDRGEVFVDVRVLACSERDEALRLSVSDTGIGIAPDDIGKLFGAFSQVDGSLARRFGGTGLGLTISKRLVEMMGGSIGVRSRLGEGSEFFCDLRLEIAGDSFTNRAAWADGRRAVIVERHPRWRGVICEHLEAWGMGVLCFDRAEEALERIEGSDDPFDVLIIGTHSGDLSVDGFVRRLRSLRGGAKLPIVALYQLGTGSFLSEVENELAAQLPKPLRFSELYNAMQEVLIGKHVSVGKMPSAQALPLAGVERVLVVDDNEINLFVAVEMLEQLGYRVETAKDGAEAVERARSEQFLVVLMDCQMPVMDGYAAAREIRRNEEGRGRHQPIVALTAHALSGERDRVLAAGMDDYVSKPVRPKSLDKIIRRYAALASNGGPPAPSTAEPAGGDACLDDTILRSGKLIALFLTNVPAQLDAIEAAARRQQPADLRSCAHKTKGSCLALGATVMARTAERLQKLAETGRLDGSIELVGAMRRQYREVAAALDRERARTQSPASETR